MQKSATDSKDKLINEASEESFPTSDPPAWTLGTNREANVGKHLNKEDISHILSHEHHIIRNVLQAIHNALTQHKTISNEALIQMSDFFKYFADDCHHRKEDLLFTLLTHGDDHPSEYLLSALKEEHATGKVIAIELMLLASADKRNDEKINTTLKKLYTFYSNHIAKEEEYLLPKINHSLSPAEIKEFLAQCKTINESITKDKYLQLIKYAEKIVKNTESA